MTLAEYLEANGLTETDFAAKVEVDQSTIHRLRKKSQIPSRDLMTKIFDKTNGLVTANDFFGIAVTAKRTRAPSDAARAA